MLARFVVVVATCASLAFAQDVLHYKFEGGGGRKVLNYASPSGIAPAEAQFVTESGYAASTLWTTGTFGGGMRASTDGSSRLYVDSGWDGAFSGSFTVAFFFKFRCAHQVSYLVDGALYCVLGPNSGAGNGLMFSGFNGRDTATLTADVLTPSLTRWVHVAFVVDSDARAYQFFVDGAPQFPSTLTDSAWNKRGESNLVVGSEHTAGYSTAYDIDEFRFSLRIVPPQEIAAWAATDPAAHTGYGKGCGGINNQGAYLGPAPGAGLPTLGNGAYALALGAFPDSSFGLAIGTSRVSLGGVPLPLDLGIVFPAWSGCLWETSGDILWISGSVDPAGRATIGLPIPSAAPFLGLILSSQVALVHRPTTMLMLSNGFSSAIGQS
jgi:hypothetical protein